MSVNLRPVFFSLFLLVLASSWMGCGEQKPVSTDPSGETEKSEPGSDFSDPIPLDTGMVDLSVLDTMASAESDSASQNRATLDEVREAVPVIKITNRTFPFGFIDEGDKVSHTFLIENTGDANLIIEDVVTSCGCTVPKLGSKNIRPGKSTNLTVVFDSEGKFGKQNKTIEVYTNALKYPVKLALTGVVRPKSGEEETESGEGDSDS
jgi:hypothetical protein